MMNIDQILFMYCDNNMAKLKRICQPMIVKIGGVSNKDYDDFYSIALDVLNDTALRYDEDQECNFDGFLASNIKRKFNTEIRDRNREKRIPAKMVDSIHNLITEDGLTLEDVIPSNFDTYESACGDHFEGTKIERYLNNLSNIQRAIVQYLVQGYDEKEIRELLHMSKKDYSNNLSVIQAYENVKILM